jgi:hypothetical protein
MNLATLEASRPGFGKEEVSFEEEEFERARFGNLIGNWRGEVVTGGFRPSLALAIVIRTPGFHASMLVGKMEKFSGEFYGDGLVAIEREEPNPGAPQFIVNVGADV